MTWLRRAPIRLLSAERLLEEVANADRVLDAGSGGRRLAVHVVNTDIAVYPSVEVVADLCGRLPFEDASFDLVVCSSVLEHVLDEQTAIDELVRVTRPGGRIWVEVPFIYHFHVSDDGDVHDFRRWTLEGVKRLVPTLETIEIGQNVGPGTALRLVAAEVLSLPLQSARHGFLYHLARWFFEWALLPLSILDRWCAGKPSSHRATGGFWLLAKKR